MQLTSLESLLGESDFVSVHCRLTDATRGMIGGQARTHEADRLLRQRRPRRRGRPAGARGHGRGPPNSGRGIDVFEVKPLPAGDPLVALDNVILTPHWSASTIDVWQATARTMALGMLRASHGELPENIVNPDVLEQPRFQQNLLQFAENATISHGMASRGRRSCDLSVESSGMQRTREGVAMSSTDLVPAPSCPPLRRTSGEGSSRHSANYCRNSCGRTAINLWRSMRSGWWSLARISWM